MAIAHMNSSEESKQPLSFSTSPRSAMSWMFASLLVLAGLLVGTFFQAAVVGGEMAYASGLKELNKPEPDFAYTTNKFARAATLNPYRDSYLLAYGQNLIFRASQEAAKEEPNVAQVQQWMRDIISVGVEATNISPNKASNWSALAQFYTNIRALVQGTDERIISAWQKAIELDPKNPSLHLQLSQAYVNASQALDPAITGTGADSDGDGLSDEMEQTFGSNPNNSDTNNNGVSDGDEVRAGFNPATSGRLDPQIIAQYTKTDQAMLVKARDSINRAIELKPDLPDSYIALSRVLQQTEQLEEAKAKLAEAATLFPGNVNILFEQGVVAFNQRAFAEAERFMQNVLSAEPNYANAHYTLGLIFEQRNDLTRALASFEKAREISGPNLELETKINEIKATLGVE
jgi:tetratricopeptide (TPR) repeat protein